MSDNQARKESAAPKKLLALDGGGIRGIITLQILSRIEELLRSETGSNESFRLSDYFDYVGGTSTGAIIATCVSLGMSVAQIQKFYSDNGAAMFDKVGLLKRLHTKYGDQQLAEKLKETFDDFLPSAEITRDENGQTVPITLGSAALKTLLMVVVRNATTDSPWPLSNNPRAKYNDRSRADCNLNLPLWKIVRASTAAPTYFPPEVVGIGEKRFVFVDGGITVYNNPAFLLFLMATIGPYRCGWETGQKKLLMVSVGTGTVAAAADELTPSDMNLLYNVSHVPAALMFSATNEQDMLCRVFGGCRHGAEIDREMGPLRDADDAGPSVPKLFTYLRYNVELSRKGLTVVGIDDIEPSNVQQMDSIRHIHALQRVGKAAATQVTAQHFLGFC
jgi:uncharacterized protein